MVISSDLKEKGGSVDKFLKWNMLNIPSKLAGCLENLT
jgi:hypothetical protein